VFGSRSLAFFALLVALVALDGVVSHAPSSTDRAVPMSSDCWDGDYDGMDVTLRPQETGPPALPNAAEPSLIEVERAPATSPFTDRIFRPPIAVLA
jgi:hypothetical protein